MNPLSDLIPVPVRGRTLFVGGETTALVPIKPVCEHLGIDFKGQRLKLRGHPVFCKGVVISPLPSEGGVQDTICIELRYFQGWLVTINPDKVAARVRDVLIAFQEQAFTLLYEAWLGSRQGFPAPLPKGARPEGSLLGRIETRPRSLSHPAFLRAQSLWRAANAAEQEGRIRAEALRQQAKHVMRMAGFSGGDFKALRAWASLDPDDRQPGLDFDGEAV